MKTNNIILAFFFLVIIGCASTTLTSYIDPSFKNKHYKSIVIEYLSSDINRKQLVESEVARLLKEKGINAFKGINLLLPTRKYSKKESADIIVGTGADGYISIILTNAYTSTSYVPPTYTTTQNYYGGYNTTSSGGYSTSSPREEFKVELIDVDSGKAAYQAYGKTNGTDFSNSTGMAKVLAEGVVTKLIKDRIIIPTVKQKK